METLKNVKISLNFNVRNKEAKQTKTPVYAVVKINEKQLKMSFGVGVNVCQWNKQKQICVVGADMLQTDRENNLQINRKINAIRAEYENYFAYLCSVNTEITTDEIKDYIKNIVENQKNTINQMTNNQPPKRTITAKTLLKKAFEMYYPKDGTKESTRKAQAYRLNAFFNYIEETKKGDTPKLLTQEGVNDYQEFLQKSGKSAKVINQYVQLIVRLINDILSIKNDFRKYNISMVRYTTIDDKRKKDDTKKRALTNEEINAIKNVQGLNEKQTEYRDIFVMQLNSGVRLSDLGKLFSHDYKEQTINGVTTYIVNTQKEGITAAIIANDEIKELQKKYGKGFKYVDFANERINEQYNNALKKIFEKAGLTQTETYYTDEGGKKVKQEKRLCDIISNHYARHTFITLKLREGYNAEEVSKMTGHADTTMIQRIYEHLTESDKAEKVIKAFERVNNQQTETETESDQKSEQSKERIDKQINLFVKLLHQKSEIIKEKIFETTPENIWKRMGRYDKEKIVEMLFDNFPNTDERRRLYQGEKIEYLANKRLQKFTRIIQLNKRCEIIVNK